MKTVTKLLAGSAAAFAVAAIAAPSQAQVVQIWEKVGATLIPLDSPQVGANSFNGSIPGGLFTINSLFGGVAADPLFTSNDIDITATAAGTVDLFISVTGLTGPVSPHEHFQTVITSNIIPAGWSVQEQAWLDPNNQPGTGTSLGLLSFTSDGVHGQTGTTDTIIDTGLGPYSISTEYKITTTGAGSSSVNNTIDVVALGVPEPATWALMIGGFGGMGVMLRRRRTSVLAV